jgi:hypothetical protein
MPDTKTLQINPALFKTGKGNKDSSEHSVPTRKKKEKPRLGAKPATLRNALIQKIKDRQSKEKQAAQEIVVNTEMTGTSSDLGNKTMSELSLGGQSEFDKSIQYMQEAIQKKRDDKAKRKQLIRQQKMQRREMMNTSSMHIAGASFAPTPKLVQTPVMVQSNPAALNKAMPAPVQMIPPSLPTPKMNPNPARVRRRTLRRMPQNPNVSLELPEAFNQHQQPSANYMARYTLPNRPEPRAQPQPSAELAKTPAPPYGCLKGGQTPTYRDWRRTLKKQDGKPKLMIRDSKPDTNMILQRLREASNKKANETAKRGRRIRRKVKKTTTKLFKLGKRQDRIGVLVKDQKTRRRIAKEHGLLRKDPIHKVREYCIHKGLIKIGSTAPNDVIRTLYEQSILTGDVSNTSKDVLLHNFVTNDH